MTRVRTGVGQAVASMGYHHSCPLELNPEGCPRMGAENREKPHVQESRWPWKLGKAGKGVLGGCGGRTALQCVSSVF